MAILSVVEQGYRATLEEQDDTILWLSHAVKKAGADLNVLLRNTAVNYAVRGQDSSGLLIGNVPLKVGPDLEHDIEALVQDGVEVYAVQEDLDTLGLRDAELVGGVRKVPRDGVPALFDRHDKVWYW